MRSSNTFTKESIISGLNQYNLVLNPEYLKSNYSFEELEKIFQEYFSENSYIIKSKIPIKSKL